MTESATLSTTTTRPRRLWPILAVLTLATLWTVTVEMLPSGLLPAMSRDLGASESTTGLLVSAWAFTIAIAGIPLVRATIRVPRTVLLATTLVTTALMNLITAVATDFAVALVGRVLTATAHGLFWAVVVSYVASIVDADRLGRALSIVLAGPTIAGLAGLPAAAYLTDLVGWRGVFAGLSLILAFTAVALWLILPHDVSATAAAAPGGRWDRSARSVLGVAIAGALVLVGHFAAFTYITALITGLGGFDGSTIPALLLVLGLTGGLGIAISGFASDRFPRAALGATAALMALGLLIVWLGSDAKVVFVAGIGVWGFAIGALPPIFQARVMRLSTPAFRP
ncbi:MAG: MFS transporter, partial [Gordonia sp. (in: high G+C Gram-positive bacteria)]